MNPGLRGPSAHFRAAPVDQPRQQMRLHEFWELASSANLLCPLALGDPMRSLFNAASVSRDTSFGAPGFFSPRFTPTLLYPPGAVEVLSIYDTSLLSHILERLVDFDSMHQRISPEHVMA